MYKFNNLKWLILGGFSALLLIGFRLDVHHSSAQTIQTPTFAYSPLVVPAAAFVADGFSADSFFFPFSGGYFQGDSTNYGCMEAPVYLPNEAEIEEVYASIYDNDATYGVNVSMRRVDNFNGGTDVLASMSTEAADAFDSIQVISDLTIDEPVVVHPGYSYYLTTCLLSGNIRLYSVRIYYKETSWIYLPIIIR